jgi:predicted nucleic acid-binding protein
MIVADTNLIGYLFLSSKRSVQAELAYGKDPVWAAPLLWRSELRNVLALYLRKKLLAIEDAHRIMNEAIEMMRGAEYEVSSLQVLNLAVSSSCSAYDCEFISLAMDLKVPLVTVDKKIIAQFPMAAIGLDRFIEAES